MHPTRTESELRNDYYRAVHALDTAATPGGRRAAAHAALHSLHAMSQLIARRTGSAPQLDAELAALERMLKTGQEQQIDESLRRNAYFFLPRG
jgi:hypothetical protein